jgi:hypothetical protein
MKKRIYDFKQFSKNETKMFAGNTGWQGQSSSDIPSEAEEYLKKDTYDLFTLEGEWLYSGDKTKIELSFHPNGVFHKDGKAYKNQDCYVTKREKNYGPNPNGKRV